MKKNTFHQSAKSASALLLALACLTMAVGCRQMTADGLNCTGVRHFQQGRYAEASECFQKAIYNEPRNADAHYNLAATYHQWGMYYKNQQYVGEARRQYNSCLRLAPNHSDCHRALAVLIAQTEGKEHAQQHLAQWAQQNPGSIDARIELARLLEEKGDTENARRQLEQAISINAYDKRNSRAWAALARIHENSGNYQQALHNYRQAYELDNFQDGVSRRIASLEGRFGGFNSGDPNGVRLVKQNPLPGAVRR